MLKLLRQTERSRVPRHDRFYRNVGKSVAVLALQLSITVGFCQTVLSAEFYVSPSGTAAGNGSLSNPWNLQTALNQPAAVKPGATIWLRGGTYRGNFTCALNGTATAPIYVRQFPGERVILDSSPNGSALAISGASYVRFWGFEVTSSGSQTTRISQQTGSWPSDLPFGGSVDVYDSTGVRLINLIVHDAQTGLGLWSTAKDLEVTGCLVYYNGWWAPDRAHGHGLYGQNQQPSWKKILDNIVFDNASHGMQVYGSGAAYLDNFTVDGNVWFNNGYIFGSNGRNLLVGGGVVANNPVIRSNSFYRGPPQADSADLYLGYGTGANNATVQNNYIVGNSTIDGAQVNLQLDGNTFYGNLYVLNKNNYPNNTYTLQRPTGVKVLVRPNQYEAGRANLVIYNWDKRNTVNVDVSTVGLAAGDQYELHNAVDYFNDVAVGTYSGGMIAVTMTNHTVATPSGLSAQASTFPEFGAFVLIRKGGAGGNTPPAISAIANQSIAVNAATGPLPFTVGDAQTPASNLTVSATSSNPALIPDGNIQLGGSAANRTVTSIPLPNKTGTATITLTVSDGALSAQTSFVISVAGVDNVSPTVSLTAPANNQTVAGTITVSAAASDNAGVAAVQFRLDGANLGVEVAAAPYSTSWNTAQTFNGAHALTAVARDTGGNATTSTPVSVMVSNDLVVPSVAITTPISGQVVSNTVTVSAAATDNVGVVGVQFKLDGANLGAEDISSPYSIAWDTTRTVNGPHTLTAVVRDAAGNQTNALGVAITVSNANSLTTGLLGFWSFNTADVNGNTLLDRSGNSGDAIAYNTTATSGQVGSARHFSGAGSYASVAADSNLRLTEDRTLSLWIRTSNASRYEGLISRYDASGMESGYLLRTTPAGVIEMRIGGNNMGTSTSRNAADTKRINDGAWHHVVAAIKIGGGITIYIDGVRSSSTPLDVRAGPGGATFQLGSNPWLEYGNYFTGDLDQVRLYNRILSDSEIVALFQEAAGGDKVAPGVSLTAPANGQTVSGTVAVSAVATDNVGVVAVQFMIDGNSLGAEVTSAPYTMAWDTKQTANGTHTLTAVARDAAANQAASVPVAFTVSNTVILTDGLVGFWSFDVADVNGSLLYDRSGNGSDAVGYNTTAITGQIGQARHFTGASSYATVSSDTNLRLTGDRTLSLWLRTTNTSRYEGLISRYDASGMESGYLLRTTPGGVLEVRIGGNNLAGGGSRNIPDTRKINDGVWHHAVVLIRPGSGVTFSIDGVRSSTTVLPIQAGPGGATFQMGSNPWLEYGNYFTGDLDQVRVYNRALSDADIATLYQEAAGGSAQQSAAVTTFSPASDRSLIMSPNITGTLDTDGNGLTDEQESLAGTDPKQADSRLRMVSVVANSAASAVTLTWASVPGWTYQILDGATPSGPWQADLPQSRITADTGQTVLSYADTTVPAEASRYYRVALVLGSGAPSVDVVTESVGVYGITLQPGNNPLAVPLQRLAEYRGAVESVADSNTVALSSTAGFVPGQFGRRDGRTQYILLVRQDAGVTPGIAGDWWPITGNSAAQIVVDNGPDNLTTLLATGSQVEIRHLVTLHDLFGSGGACVLTRRDRIWLGAGPKKGSPICYRTAKAEGYYQGAVFLGDGSTITLAPDQALTVSRLARSAGVTVHWVGQVQVTALTHYLNPGDNLIGNPFPMAARLDQSNLQLAGWVADADLVANPADEDLIRAVGPGGLGATVYYHNGALSAAGWYVDGVASNSFALGPAQAYRFWIQPGTGALRWRQPVPFTP